MEDLMTTDELTREALNHLEGYDRGDYDARDWYGNVLADGTHGKTQNWDSASSGFVPANTVNYIKTQFDSVGAGVASVASEAIAEAERYSPDARDMSRRMVIGVVKKIAERFGRGAEAELRAEDLISSRGESVAEAKESDENRGIDIRTEDGKTYQVKRASEYRSDWGNKTVNDVLWVKPDGEIYSPYGEDGYKDVTKLT